MIKKIGNFICVIHAHKRKPGVPGDKPRGTPIKCYSISKLGTKKAEALAQKLHQAIIISKRQRGVI